MSAPAKKVSIVFTRTGACVRAYWLGEVRTVLEGTVFECIAYVARTE